MFGLNPLALLTSRAGIVGMIALGLVLLFGIQEGRLKHAQRASQIAQDGWNTCKASIATQNAALAAQSARSMAAVNAATKAVASIAPRAKRYSDAGDRLAGVKVSGVAQCERWQDADEQVKAALQP